MLCRLTPILSHTFEHIRGHLSSKPGNREYILITNNKIHNKNDIHDKNDENKSFKCKDTYTIVPANCAQVQHRLGTWDPQLLKYAIRPVAITVKNRKALNHVFKVTWCQSNTVISKGKS